MADQFIGEIRMFTGNYAPANWAFCDGQLLPIAQNMTLFSLLGTYYGGDGRVTFALPNLQGATPMGQGAGPGLTPRELGETGGEAAVTLLTSEMPNHNHAVNASSSPGTTEDPTNATWGAGGRGQPAAYSATADTTMSPMAISVTGSSMPHNNRQPYLVINFIIALEGYFPPRG